MSQDDTVRIGGKRVVINAELLRYNPYRVDMSRTCAVCGAPPHAFCVPSMHREQSWQDDEVERLAADGVEGF